LSFQTVRIDYTSIRLVKILCMLVTCSCIQHLNICIT